MFMINVLSAFPVVLEIINIEPVNFKLSFQIKNLLPDVTKLIKIMSHVEWTCINVME